MKVKLLLIGTSFILGTYLFNYNVSALENNNIEQREEFKKVYRMKINPIKIASELLNKTTEELKTKLDNGENLYTILEQSAKLDQFKTKYLEELKTKLQEMVDNNKITAEESNTIYSKKEESLTNWSKDNDIFLKKELHHKRLPEVFIN